MVYRAPVGARAWFPSAIEGDLVVLRRHMPENVTAFQRWYSDPEVARLARYQDAPMRPTRSTGSSSSGRSAPSR